MQLSSDPEPHEERPSWCFYAEYESYKNFQETTRPPHVYIQFKGKDAINVYVPCTTSWIRKAHASSAQTSVTVSVTAEVSCNPQNCLELPEEEPAEVYNLHPRWWHKMLQWIVETLAP